MKRKTKIILFTVLIALVVCIAVDGGVNATLSRMVLRRVNKVLASIPGCEASVGDIQVSVFSGTATVQDIKFSYQAELIGENTVAPGSVFEVERVEVGHVFYSMLLNKKALIHSVSIVRPRIELWLDEEHPELSFPAIETDTTVKNLIFPLVRAELMSLHLEEASVAFHSTRTPLDVAAEEFSFTMHDLVYDSVFSCDSAFRFSLEQASLTLPDGVTHLHTHDIAFQNGELLTVGATRFVNTRHVKKTAKMGADIAVERVEIGPLSYLMFFDKEWIVKNARILRPRVELWMDEDQPELCFPVMPKKKKKTTMPFKRIALQHLAVQNASFALHSTRTQFDVVADSCSVAMNHISYGKTFRCSDSLYHLSLAHAAVMLPDGSMRIEARGLEHSNQGALVLGPTRIANTMPKMKLGEMLQEPATWIDMQIESVRTSPFSLIRKALAQDFTLDKVEAVVAKMDVLRDLRFKPKRPFIMPQQALTGLDVPFLLRHAQAELKQVNIELTSTDINCGKLQFKNISAAVDNITNRRNETMHMKATCPFEPGVVKAQMDMTMNYTCNFMTSLHAENVDASFLNSLIRPLVGMTCELQIDTFDTRYEGDHNFAIGDFRMLYHGLRATVHKEDDIPYKIVSKAATSINVVANTLLPKSNPATPRGRPKAYNIEWKRDDWSPTELYLFGPCIDGVIKTLLPGLFIHERVKKKK